jgi:DNA-binding LytR/AlgR family response regulator
MINIAICDDNKTVIEEIKSYIKHFKEAEFLITTYNCGEALLIEKKIFHIIFLDIDMSGIDGIETAKIIRSYDKAVKIIYVTSYIEYVNQAFEVHAFGYLNKPIKKDQILKQLKEALEYSKEEEEETVEFVTSEGIVRLSPSSIYFFEFINRKVRIKTFTKDYTLKENITTIAKDMSKFGFLMPHKSFTVNLYHVKSIKGYDIFMMDGTIIPLSQKKSSEFREQFNIFLENHIQKL